MSSTDSAAAAPVGVRPAPAPAVPARRRPLSEMQGAVVLGWLLLAGAFLGAWEWAGQTGHLNVLFFSYPSAIWGALLEGLQGDLLTLDTRYTLLAAVIGFSTAAAAGVVVAFALSQLPYVNRVLQPFFTGFNSLPRVALAPLFIMWFGIGLTSHVVMAASLTFFVVFANTMAGIENVDQDHLLLAKLHGATKWQTFRLYIVPSALPSIFVGLELGFIFGMLGTVSGEMIAGEHGLGVRLQRDAGVFNTKGYFATLFTLIVISSILIAVFKVIKARLIRWQGVHIVRRS